MARKKKPEVPEKPKSKDPAAHIEGAGIIERQNITDTLETNYMPYAMSVILSRAIPEIDGFKPSHRKLLYTMYKMGLLSGAKIKSANIVGRTMQLNPHGDAAIYETMVRMTTGNETLLHPFVESKGNFGKAYSRNMAYAAARYTEAKLAPICKELFVDIDKDTVDFVDNYDSTMKEPVLFPTRFPNILCNVNTGIAVGMASNICSFNLREVCDAAMGLIRNPDYDIADSIKAPDFSGGGSIVYDRAAIDAVLNTGRGGIKVRAKYTYDKSGNCIDITEIPPTTTSEAIIDRIIELAKAGKIREISDIRDETDKTGLKITIDLKRSVDYNKLMRRLFKLTPLEDSFPCNFNILVGGSPVVMGVKDILVEWLAFRAECVTRRTFHELTGAKDRLHLLEGLQLILLDIDKAISIIRGTELESDVVPNLMTGFGIDEVQANYVAEIKLRHLNREFILKKLEDLEDLKAAIADMEDILAHKRRIDKIIVSELKEVSETFGIDRRTDIIYDTPDEDEDVREDAAPDYPVRIFFTREGYFKKITPQSLRLSNVQKLKDGDGIVLEKDSTNNASLLFFTDKCSAYKAKVSDFADTKASVLGDYVPAVMGFDPDEKALFAVETTDYSETLIIFYDNGNCAKFPISSYETKQNRRKLVGAYCPDQTPVAVFAVKADEEFVLYSSSDRILIFNSAAILMKSTRTTRGVAVMKQLKGKQLVSAKRLSHCEFKDPSRYRTKTIPARGATVAAQDIGEQLTFAPDASDD
ncbi:MAG: topoisomerase IV [Clostridia bacterium]|nr:topoisomerase IV [Clostridia bacterium]